MKLYIRALALAAALLLGLTVPSAHGAETGFASVRTYGEQFIDVSPDAWYYDTVRALYELGLTNGKGTPDRFAPEDDMTLSEALTLAARLRSLYKTGGSETGPGAYGGSVWYMPYVAYLQAEEVIGWEFAENYESPATRAEIAHVLANTLPREYFTSRNEEMVIAGRASGGFMRDVNTSTRYEADIVQLYDWGILGGVDASGSFRPEQFISRCEVAAMASRLVYDELRITLDWDLDRNQLSGVGQGGAMAALVTSDGTFYPSPAPDDADQIAADVRYMLSRGERSLTLQYDPDGMDSEALGELAEAFLYEVRQYVEQTYNYLYCTSSPRTGKMSLTFSSSLYGEEDLERYRRETLAYAQAVRDRLWAEGALTADMSEYEKARVYFTWVCENCRYDADAVGADGSMSHSGWRLFTEGLAVCDGYTAAYNLLLKLEGIDCGTYTLESRNHIWTVAVLDGTAYHIDATWGDQTERIAYRYFGMTEEESLIRFSRS